MVRAAQFHFTPEANSYCSGAYSKGLLKQGLTYEIDQRTDYRRAKSANARRGDIVSDKDKKTDVPEKVVLATGQDVFDCLVRKFMTLLLLFGDADIASHGFTSGSYGTLAGTTRWITLADVYKLKKAAAGLVKLPRAKAEELVDWFEEKISVAVKAPFLRTLACALGENNDVFEARIDSRIVAATPPATKRERLDAGPPSGLRLAHKDGEAPPRRYHRPGVRNRALYDMYTCCMREGTFLRPLELVRSAAAYSTRVMSLLTVPCYELLEHIRVLPPGRGQRGRLRPPTRASRAKLLLCCYLFALRP